MSDPADPFGYRLIDYYWYFFNYCTCSIKMKCFFIGLANLSDYKMKCKDKILITGEFYITKHYSVYQNKYEIPLETMSP